MSLENEILEDYKAALKNKDKLKVLVLSLLRAELKNYIIQTQNKQLSDDDVIKIIKKHTARNQDSIKQFESGNRADLAEKEKQEYLILKAYLPEELSEEKVRQVIDSAITELKAQDIKSMGAVMKEVLSKIGSQADGKLISAIVKARLSP
ncbi:MAG: GatB/YqeY domain-containing protein [Candidatus Gygaella obscura]|nr:GatB/YqeY domain-containing protein [Candidatus Gygaella obscura]